jgi:hypothetical protein
VSTALNGACVPELVQPVALWLSGTAELAQATIVTVPALAAVVPAKPKLRTTTAAPSALPTL